MITAPSGTEDGISCGSNCTENYDPDTSVSLTATPSSDSLFDSWLGDCSGTSNPYTLIMNGDKFCNAQFKTIATFNITPVASSMEVGGETDLVALYDPDGDGPQTVRVVTKSSNWSSSNEVIAKVDDESQKGKVTGTRPGNVIITATYTNPLGNVMVANANIAVSFQPFWKEIIPWYQR